MYKKTSTQLGIILPLAMVALMLTVVEVMMYSVMILRDSFECIEWKLSILPFQNLEMITWPRVWWPHSVWYCTLSGKRKNESGKAAAAYATSWPRPYASRMETNLSAFCEK